MQKLNICLVHEEYPEETNFGGIATYQKICAEEYVRQGHNVYVICRGLSKDSHYIENGVDITRIFVPRSGDDVADYIKYRERVSDKLQQLQSQNKIDIIEVPDWGAETVLFEKYRKVPLVVRLHTPLKVWLKYNNNDFGKAKDLVLSWEDEMLKKADLITCCSGILKKMIVKDFKIKADKIIVTPNPANITRYFYDKDVKKENILLFVGSVEARKGVLVLAKALNKVFREIPDLKMIFVGKDTIRNNLNISTTEYIKNLVEDKYLANVEFKGHIPTEELNHYFNKAKCAVFPSLFDNFPYVVLETMATGTPIVGSSNSGMVEMLEDKTCLYNGSVNDLASKLIHSLKRKTFIERNITRVKSIYNPTTVCENMIKMYHSTLINYYSYNDTIEHFNHIFKDNIEDNITSLQEFKGGVANKVYLASTSSKDYIIKKYLYEYNFDLAKELYNIYEKNNIAIAKPINDTPIYTNFAQYNIFEHIQKDNTPMSDDLLLNLVTIDRSTTLAPTLKSKCDFYYNSIDVLKNEYNKIFAFSEYVQKIYKQIDYDESSASINHGDISKTNIVCSKDKNYIIDFDECVVTNPLYDFATASIKFYSNKGKLKEKDFGIYLEKVMSALSIDKYECFNVIKFYLCKILLEKFYLHYLGKINLFSHSQKKDNFEWYLKLLKYFNAK